MAIAAFLERSRGRGGLYCALTSRRRSLLPARSDFASPTPYLYLVRVRDPVTGQLIQAGEVGELDLVPPNWKTFGESETEADGILSPQKLFACAGEEQPVYPLICDPGWQLKVHPVSADIRCEQCPAGTWSRDFGRECSMEECALAC